MSRTGQYSLAFLVQQLTLLCVILALLKPFVWLAGSEANVTLGDDPANCLNVLVSILIVMSVGAFMGGHWSKAGLAAAIGAVIGLGYGVLNWKYVIVD
jgi:hypothetical protein